MRETCTCGHDRTLHTHTASIRRGYRCPCLRIGCDCTTYTPAPAGVSAAPTSRDRPIGPAGAPIPTTSEEQCERCGRILDCCRRCPVHEGDVDE